MSFGFETTPGPQGRDVRAAARVVTPDLKALAKKLGRPIATLEVLGNHPFRAGDVEHRRKKAEWITELWGRFNIQPGAHLRRVHYVLVSQEPGNVLLPDGSTYLNIERAYQTLNLSALDARYLDLIPATDLVDRRNDEPMIYLVEEEGAGFIYAGSGEFKIEPRELLVPSLDLISPKIPLRYHLEIWCEKSTINDVLMAFGERYGVNIVTGAGEISYTRCVQLVERAIASGRPVRILYISDFDPAGDNMPVSGRTQDRVPVVPAAGAPPRCSAPANHADARSMYRVSSSAYSDQRDRQAREPFRGAVRRGRNRAGCARSAAPGELERILRREVERYHDDTLDDRIAEAASDVEAELDRINATVHRRHAKAIAEIRAERKKVHAAIAAFEKKARPVFKEIEEDLEAEAPDIDDYEWPEPAEGDEDDDPLFDSTRDFIEQTDRYKAHQGKPTASKWKSRPTFTLTCDCCGNTFETTKRPTRWMACSQTCRETLRYRGDDIPRPCRVIRLISVTRPPFGDWPGRMV